MLVSIELTIEVKTDVMVDAGGVTSLVKMLVISLVSVTAGSCVVIGGRVIV